LVRAVLGHVTEDTGTNDHNDSSRNEAVSSTKGLATAKGVSSASTVTTGSYLATGLEQIGLKHHFAVAGDYNLVLLESRIPH
jgi:hypothetical protein